MVMLDFIGRSSTFNLFIGLSFIAFGALFLLSNYGFIPSVEWGKIWPLVLILMGFAFLLKGQMYVHERGRNWL